MFLILLGMLVFYWLLIKIFVNGVIVGYNWVLDWGCFDMFSLFNCRGINYLYEYKDFIIYGNLRFRWVFFFNLIILMLSM